MFPIAIAWPSSAIEALAVCVYVLLASLATADVLLKKSDVRGALGWIAAAWRERCGRSSAYKRYARLPRMAMQQRERRLQLAGPRLRDHVGRNAATFEPAAVGPGHI